MNFDYTRIDILNFVIAQHGFTRYLEIGTYQDTCFNAIAATHKVGVDPTSGGTLRMTSDEFFAQNTEKFELIFIDGLHHHDQVFKDITNALLCVEPHGFILMHDSFPPREKDEAPGRCSTSWRAFAHFRQDPNLDAIVGDFDWGVGIIRQRENTRPITLPRHFADLTYTEMHENRDTWMRLTDSKLAREFCQ